MKKIYSSLLIAIVSSLSLISLTDSIYAACGGWTLGFGCPTPGQIEYCQNGSCTLSGGLLATSNAVGDTFTKKTIAVYVTDTVLYFLGFVTLVAVVYIIYAGVQIMTGGGDEEKIKKARQTIIYVITGIIFIWIAPWFIWVVLTAIN